MRSGFQLSTEPMTVQVLQQKLKLVGGGVVVPLINEQNESMGKRTRGWGWSKVEYYWVGVRRRLKTWLFQGNEVPLVERVVHYLEESRAV